MIGAERVDFVAIPTRDQERARKFYGETLGFDRNRRTPDQFAEFETGNVTMLLVVPEEVGIEFAPLPVGAVAIRVPDVAAARAKLEASGVEFRGETIDSGVCHMAFFWDPDGNGLLLHHRYAPYSDGTQP